MAKSKTPASLINFVRTKASSISSQLHILHSKMGYQRKRIVMEMAILMLKEKGLPKTPFRQKQFTQLLIY